MFNSLASLSYSREILTPPRETDPFLPKARANPDLYVKRALIADVALTVGLIAAAVIGHHFGLSSNVEGLLIGTAVAYGLWTALRIKHSLNLAGKVKPLENYLFKSNDQNLDKARKNHYRNICLAAMLALSVTLIILGIKLYADDTLLHHGLIAGGSVGLGYVALTSVQRLTHRKFEKDFDDLASRKSDQMPLKAPTDVSVARTPESDT